MQSAAALAATAGPPAPRPLVPGLPQKAAPLVPPARITNEGREWLHDHKKRVYRDFIPVERIQIPEPELGPLERRVELSYQDAINRGEPNLKDMDYWFTEPAEGWHPTVIAEIAEVLPNEEIETLHTEPGRTPLESLQPGEEVTGEVVGILYYHGLLVDIGAEHDGLVPIEPLEWEAMTEQFKVGEKLRVTMHKTREADLYRWPVQLVLESMELQSTAAPDEWYCPMDLRGFTMEELNLRLGREFTPLVFEEDTTTGVEAFKNAGFEDLYGAKAEAPPEGIPERDLVSIDAAAGLLAEALDC